MQCVFLKSTYHVSTPCLFRVELRWTHPPPPVKLLSSKKENDVANFGSESLRRGILLQLAATALPEDFRIVYVCGSARP